MSTDLDLSKLSHAEKDALILSQLARLDAALKLIAKLQARIDDLTRLSPCRLEGSASISVQAGAGLRGMSISGIKRDENINILGPCAESERRRR